MVAKQNASEPRQFDLRNADRIIAIGYGVIVRRTEDNQLFEVLPHSHYVWTEGGEPGLAAVVGVPGPHASCANRTLRSSRELVEDRQSWLSGSRAE